MGGTCAKCKEYYASDAGPYRLKGESLCHSCFWRDRLNQPKTATQQQILDERSCDHCLGLFIDLYPYKGMDLCAECRFEIEYTKQPCAMCGHMSTQLVYFQGKGSKLCYTCNTQAINAMVTQTVAQSQAQKKKIGYDSLLNDYWDSAMENTQSPSLKGITKIADYNPYDKRHETKPQPLKTVEPDHIPLEKKGRKLNLDEL